MPFAADVIGAAVLVYWSASPTPEDARALGALVAEAHREIGQPVVFIAVIPPGASRPTAEARAAMGRSIKDIANRCESLHLVLEGEGFALATLRSIRSALSLASGTQRLVRIHHSVAEAAAAAQGRVEEAVKIIRAMERLRGSS